MKVTFSGASIYLYNNQDLWCLFSVILKTNEHPSYTIKAIPEGTPNLPHPVKMIEGVIRDTLSNIRQFDIGLCFWTSEHAEQRNSVGGVPFVPSLDTTISEKDCVPA